MNQRRRNILLSVLALPIGRAMADQPDPEKLALEQAVRLADSFESEDEARKWLGAMSRRLRHQIINPYYRTELLRHIHHQARRVGLKPELVMAVIQVESSFNRYAVSGVGARGLMQLMPFWIKEIGHPSDDLFNPVINLRYGCLVLKNYLRQTRGNLDKALSLYHGSGEPGYYAVRVRHAMQSFSLG